MSYPAIAWRQIKKQGKKEKYKETMKREKEKKGKKKYYERSKLIKEQNKNKKMSKNEVLNVY